MKVKAWDTKGVANVGAIRGGKLNLTFEGMDGQKRNIFIPLGSAASLINGLASIAGAAMTQEGKPGDLDGLIEALSTALKVAQGAKMETGSRRH